MNLRAVTLISGSLASALSSFSVNDDNLSGGTDATSLSWLKSRGPGWPEGRAAGNIERGVERETRFQISPLHNYSSQSAGGRLFTLDICEFRWKNTVHRGQIEWISGEVLLMFHVHKNIWFHIVPIETSLSLPLCAFMRVCICILTFSFFGQIDEMKMDPFTYMLQNNKLWFSQKYQILVFAITF